MPVGCQKGYNSDDIVASGKLLFADNCLQVAYDLKTNCESAPNTETSTSETENTLRTSDTVELIGYVATHKRRGLNCTKARTTRSQSQRFRMI